METKNKLTNQQIDKAILEFILFIVMFTGVIICLSYFALIN